MKLPAPYAALAGRFGGLMRALVMASAASIAVTAAHAQVSAIWSAVGPPGGTTTAVRANPVVAGAVYAGTAENGIFYSTDAGLTWAAASSGLAPSNDTGRQQLYAVFALASDGQYMYAATGSGLYYSAADAAPQWLPLAGRRTPRGSPCWPSMPVRSACSRPAT